MVAEILSLKLGCLPATLYIVKRRIEGGENGGLKSVDTPLRLRSQIGESTLRAA